MGIPSQQIGWSTEAKLLYELIKQMDRLIKIMGSVYSTTTTTTTIAP